MKVESIRLDWPKEFGIEVYESDRAYEIYSLNDLKFSKNPYDTYCNAKVGDIKKFEHKEYAFKFSEHELRTVDLKATLTLIEKIIVCEEWEWFAPCETLDPIRFNRYFYGKLQVFNLSSIVIGHILPIHSPGSVEYLNNTIANIIRLAKNKNERPVFFRRIPWELRTRPSILWYPDTGYAEKYNFETRKMKKPTEDEIVNNASLYTRFSTGFV